jgi:hypothetical protein
MEIEIEGLDATILKFIKQVAHLFTKLLLAGLVLT